MLSLIKSRILINLYGYARGLLNIHMPLYFFLALFYNFISKSKMSTLHFTAI
ncbi:hypothetical protein [Candidatus Lariskella endosymbiont of Epinotia ramella]|uniref:hypothetical protein n=1 Tax=Candidatus Lariskella endosymbiont of Epinotia ramella TaxID=3066224 RepID=UPI0030D3C6E7